jgi:hypothetical protein
MRRYKKAGVPVAFEQIHAMVRIGFLSVQCRKPEMDFMSKAECPHLESTSLPHLSIADVNTHLATYSDHDLAVLMRWTDVDARGRRVIGNKHSNVPFILCAFTLKVSRAPTSSCTGIRATARCLLLSAEASPSISLNLGSSAYSQWPSWEDQA